MSSSVASPASRRVSATETGHADKLGRSSLRVIAAVTMLTALIVVIALPLYLADLSANPKEI